MSQRPHRTRSALARALAAVAFGLAIPGTAPAQLSDAQRETLQAPGTFRPEVVKVFETQRNARVFVLLGESETLRPLWRESRKSARARHSLRREILQRRAAVLLALPRGSYRVERSFLATNALVLMVNLEGALALAASDWVSGVALDMPVRAQLAETIPLVNLDGPHTDGLDGLDVQIAILDTGVDTSHPDLSGAVIAEQCYCTGCCVGGADTGSGTGSAPDSHGHGTMVAGIAASRNGTAPGAAPAAEIVAVKVLNDSGSGPVSDVVAGLDWILASRPDVDVVNLSLAVTNEFYVGDCDSSSSSTMMFATPIDALRTSGVLTVAGAGNNGVDYGMNPPACIANTFSVGAVWDADVGSQSKFACTDTTTAADQVTCFSNSGSTTDAFAPGGVIVTTDTGGGTAEAKGTSFATPVVSGCAAVVLDARPYLSVDALEAALKTSDTVVTHGAHDFPRLDCEAALRAARPDRVGSLSPSGVASLASLIALLGTLAQRASR